MTSNWFMGGLWSCAITRCRCPYHGRTWSAKRFVRQTDECEISERVILRGTAMGRVSQKSRMVLPSSQSYYIAKIARILNASENTVRQWIVRYEPYGIDGLCDRSRSGRLPKVSSALRAFMEQDVQHKSAEFAYRLASELLGSCVPMSKQNIVLRLIRLQCITC